MTLCRLAQRERSRKESSPDKGMCVREKIRSVTLENDGIFHLIVPSRSAKSLRRDEISNY
jgi:hypothetical protein